MSAMLLRIIACVCMLIDHIGFQYNIYLFRCIGRIAFPIFVYLICNGYRYTSNRWRYALRLGIFALISQIPFSMFCYNSLWNRNGNVFVTLFLCLVCIWTADVMLRRKKLRLIAFLPTLLICALYYFDVLSSDYGIRGILFAMLFFFYAKHERGWILPVGMLLAIYYPFLLGCTKWLFGSSFPTISRWEATQIFSLCALPLVRSYNGLRGRAPASPFLAKCFQIGFYLFYPVHMLALWIVRIF